MPKDTLDSVDVSIGTHLQQFVVIDKSISTHERLLFELNYDRDSAQLIKALKSIPSTLNLHMQTAS
jgi:hypothetical protein